MKLLSAIFLIFTLVGIIGAMIEAVTYAGLINKFIDFSPRIIISISIFVSVASLFNKNSFAIPNLIKNINNYFLLPLLLISSIIFTFLEVINYSNFVFSTFHLHYDSIYYAFLGSLSITVFSLEKKKVFLNKQKYIFLLSALLILSALIIRVWPNGAFYSLIREDSLLEDLQFVFYALSGASFLMFALKIRTKNKLFFLYFLLFSLFMFFIAFEEISWGQRLIGIESPEIAIENNSQKEITLHNINGLNELQPIMYMLFSYVLSFGWIALRFFPKKFSVLLPNWYFILYFLPILIFYIHINVFMGENWHWQEVCELFLSLGILIFSIEVSSTKSTKNF